MAKKNKNEELIVRLNEIQSQLNEVKSEAGFVVEEADVVFTRQQLEDFLIEYTNKVNQYKLTSSEDGIILSLAQFPGGVPAFYQFVSKEMEFPKSAAKKGLKGRVYVQFVINKDGTIDDASVRVMPREEIAQVGGSMPMDILSDPDCEAEAMRVIRGSPKWEPAQHKGKPVMQQMAVPILFEK